MRNKKIVIALAATAVLTATVSVAAYRSSSASANGRTRASSAADVPVYDAKTDIAGATHALDNNCMTLSNCVFVGKIGPTVALGPSRTIGDAVYNCGSAYAEDSVEIADERSESTTLEESLSASLKLGFLKLELEAISKQFERTSNTLGESHAVAVAPGWKGWIDTQVPTASVTGYITDNVHFKVTNFELSYPGYGEPEGLRKIAWTGVHDSMTSEDQSSRCAKLPTLTPPGVVGRTQRATGLAITVCTSTHSPAHGARASDAASCATRRVLHEYRIPLAANKEHLLLTRRHTVYATGIVSKKRRVILTANHKLRLGVYTLLLTTPRQSSMLPVTLR